ncbi:hypothetical protein NHJ13734_009324 [Beauveria thailandica]
MAELEKRTDDDNDEGIEVDELSGEVLHVGGSWNIKISRLWHQFPEKGNPMEAWGKKKSMGDGEDERRTRPEAEDLVADSRTALLELEGGYVA